MRGQGGVLPMEWSRLWRDDERREWQQPHTPRYTPEPWPKPEQLEEEVAKGASLPFSGEGEEKMLYPEGSLRAEDAAPRFWKYDEGRFSSSFRGPYPRYARGPYRYDEEEPPMGGGGSMWQIAGALLFLALAWLAFRTDVPYAQQARNMLTWAMERDDAWSVISHWYQESIAPRLSPSRSVSVPSSSSSSTVPPLSQSSVKEGYEETRHPLLLLTGKAGETVRAATRGIVEKVDKNDQYGSYVVINHGEPTGKTLYGRLATIQVQVNDWVETGQSIGQLAPNDGAELLFGYIKQNRFVDPQAILIRRDGP